MKFLHLADLHLGKRVNGFDLLEDQRYILEQILALCDSNKVDAVVLAGDIYDAPVPPAAACTLLDWFLTQLAARRIAVLAVSGNHDSAERLDYAAAITCPRPTCPITTAPSPPRWPPVRPAPSAACWWPIRW